MVNGISPELQNRSLVSDPRAQTKTENAFNNAVKPPQNPPQKLGWKAWAASWVGSVAANVAMNPDQDVALRNAQRLIVCFGENTARQLTGLIHALSPTIATVLYPQLPSAINLTQEDRFPAQIEYVLNNAFANLAESAQTSVVKDQITFVDLISHIVRIIKNNPNCNGLLDSLQKIESNPEYADLKAQLKPLKSDSKDYKRIMQNPLIIERNKLIKELFVPLINAAFPNGAKDLQFQGVGVVASLATGTAQNYVWSMIQDPATFGPLYDLLQLNFADRPLRATTQLMSFDLANLLKNQLSAPALPNNAVSRVPSREMDEKYAEELHPIAQAEQKHAAENNASAKPTQSMTDFIAELAVGFLIPADKKNDADKAAGKATIKSPEQKDIESLLSNMIRDIASSKDPNMDVLWKFLADTFGTALRYGVENLATTKALLGNEQEVKEAAESINSIMKKGSVNLGQILIEFLQKNGTEIQKNYQTIIKLANAKEEDVKAKKEKDAWIKRVFTPLAVKLVDNLLITNEFATQVEKDRIAGLKKSVVEKAPEWLFTGCSSILESQPGLLGWLNPTESVKALKAKLEKTPSGKAAIAIAKSTSDIIVDQLGANAQSIANIVITNVFPSFAQDNPQVASIKQLVMDAVAYATTNPDAQAFIKAHISDAFLNILLSSDQKNGQGEWSFAELINTCRHDILEHYNQNSNLLEAEGTKEEKIKDFFIPLAEKLIKRLKLDQQAKLNIANLQDIIKVQIADQLYGLFEMLGKAKSGKGTAQDGLWNLLEGPQQMAKLINEREDLEDELRLLQMDEEDAKSAQEKDALYEKQAKIISAVTQIANQEAALEEQLIQLNNLSSGIVAPFIRDQAQQFAGDIVTNNDTIVQQLSEGLKLDLDAQSKQWLQAELQKVVAANNPGKEALWNFAQQILSVTVPKIVLNVIKSIETAGQKAQEERNKTVSEATKTVKSSVLEVLTAGESDPKAIKEIPAANKQKVVDRNNAVKAGMLSAMTAGEKEVDEKAQAAEAEIKQRIADNRSAAVQGIRTALNGGIELPTAPKPEQYVPPAAPQQHPLQNILVQVIERASTVAYDKFKGHPKDLMQNDRQERQAIAAWELRARNLQAQIANAQGMSKEDHESLEDDLTNLNKKIEAGKKDLAKNHQELVKEFLPLAKAIFQEMGPDINAPEHPIHSLPLPPNLKARIWDEDGPKAVAEILASNVYKEIYRDDPRQLRAGLQAIYGDSNVVSELCRVLGVMTRDTVPHVLADDKDNMMGKAIYALILGMIQKAPENAAKDSFLGYINQNRSALEGWLEGNLHTIGRKAAQKDGAEDTRSPAMIAVWDEVAKVTETGLLKFMLKFSTSMKDIEQGNPEILMKLVPTILPIISKHVEDVNEAVKAASKTGSFLDHLTPAKHLHDIEPEKLMKEFAKIGQLHKALRPVVLYTDADLKDLTANQRKERFHVIDRAGIARHLAREKMPAITPAQLKIVAAAIPAHEIDTFLADQAKVEKLKAAKTAEQKMKHFYKPLTAKLIELAQVTGGDLPFGDLTLDIIKEQAPIIVGMIWEKLGSDDTLFGIVKAMSKTTYDKLPQGLGDVDDIFGYSSAPPPADPTGTPASAIEKADWKDLLRQMSHALPLLLRAAADFEFNGQSLLNPTGEVLRDQTNQYLKGFTLTKLIDDMIFKNALEGVLLGGEYDPVSKEFKGKKLTGRVNGIDQFEPAPVGFLPPKDPSQVNQWAVERTAQLKKEAVKEASRAINAGITGFMKKLRNQMIYEKIGKIIDLIPVRAVRVVLKGFVRFVAKILQLSFFIPYLIYSEIQELVVKKHIERWLKNMKHPINENVAMQVSFNALDQLIGVHKQLNSSLGRYDNAMDLLEQRDPKLKKAILAKLLEKMDELKKSERSEELRDRFKKLDIDQRNLFLATLDQQMNSLKPAAGSPAVAPVAPVAPVIIAPKVDDGMGLGFKDSPKPAVVGLNDNSNL